MAATHTFQDHISELRKRILWVGLAVIASAGIAYALHESIIKILQKPYGQTLIYTSPAGSFNFIIELSVIVGIFITLPVIIYHMVRFLEPALPQRVTRGMLIKTIGSSFLLAIAGICFGFFLMIPISLHFFLGFSSEQIKPLITAQEYLRFVLNHMLTFALAFQIPMVFWFINRIKPLNPKSILKYQRHVVVIAFGLALVLPFTYDPVSQFIVAVPIVFLYYLSVALVWFANRKRKTPETAFVKPLAPIPVPSFTPNISRNPKPVEWPQPAIAQTRSRSLDGFITSHQQTSTPISNLDKIETLPTPAVDPKPIEYNLRRPGLAIDGVSPLLG